MARNRSVAKATTSEAEERTADMSVSVLECRDVGHIWKSNGGKAGYVVVEGGPKGKRVVERVLACGCCGTTREDVFAVNGSGMVERVSRKYGYADGYLFKPTAGPHDRLRRGHIQYVLLKRVYPDVGW